MKLFKLAGLSLCAGVAALGTDLTSGFSAADAQQLTLDQVLQAVRNERSASSAENQERERRFLAERNNQQAALNRVRRYCLSIVGRRCFRPRRAIEVLGQFKVKRLHQKGPMVGIVFD